MENEQSHELMDQDKAPDVMTELSDFQAEIRALSEEAQPDKHLVGMDCSELSMVDMQAWVTFQKLEHAGYPEEYVKAFEVELDNIQQHPKQSQASIDFIAFVRNKFVSGANHGRTNIK